MAETYRQALAKRIILMRRKDPSAPIITLYQILDEHPFTSMQYVDTCLPTPINWVEKKKGPYAFTRITTDCTKKPNKFSDLDLRVIAKRIGEIMTDYEKPHNPHFSELAEIQKEMRTVLHYLHMYLLLKTPPNDPADQLFRMGYCTLIKTTLKHNIFKFNQKLLLEWLKTNHCKILESFKVFFRPRNVEYRDNLTQKEPEEEEEEEESEESEESEEEEEPEEGDPEELLKLRELQTLRKIVKTGLNRSQYCVVGFVARWLRIYRRTSIFLMPRRVSQFFKCLGARPTHALFVAVQNFTHVILDTHDSYITGMDPSAILRLIQNTCEIVDLAAFLGLCCLIAYKEVNEEDNNIANTINTAVQHIIQHRNLDSFQLRCLYVRIPTEEAYTPILDLFKNMPRLPDRFPELEEEDYAARMWHTMSQTTDEYHGYG